jgi:(1->4)-alpha-D-glucan 1-alpha-D-glucosylmutase
VRATYRLQLTKDFGFAEAESVLLYLEDLGISHVYLSPVLMAKSDHGYDVTDPTKLNPVLGSFEPFAAAVHARGMGIVLDIVPNHMAADPQNAWWADVLEHGEASEWSFVFDVNWEKGDGKVTFGDRVRNYRRFFEINELVGVRVEDPHVFDVTHSKVLSLVRDGLVDALRIDHIDGLRDPLSYLRRLRDAVGDGVPILVEKILARGETLPKAWPVQGTTGYDFIDAVDGLFVSAGGFRRLRRGFPPYARVVADAKREMLNGPFAGEVSDIVDLLGDDAPRRALREALIEITVHLDTYRTYADGSGMPSGDRARVRVAAGKAKVRDVRALRLVRDMLLRCDPLEAVLRWQQLSGPAMAKGAEDTALYRYPVLLSRNEVGTSPGHAPLDVDAFHEWALARSRTTMNASSSHDTKRSEDVRARIDALSERPDVEQPTTDIERYFFQTVLGSYVEDDGYADRIARVMLKSVREAKLETSWSAPDEAYEARIESYVRTALTDRRFVRRLARLLGDVESAAVANSLARVVLKVFLPGVPDFYQGAEDTYLRLVDPDNRAPAPFAGSGLKYEVTKTALDVRRRFADVCAKGSYEPVRAGDGAVAFVRRLRKRAVLVVVERPPRGSTARLRVEGAWRDAFTGEVRDRLEVGELFTRVPVAILTTD